MNKLIIFFLCFILSLTTGAYAVSKQKIQCSPQLKEIIQTIQKLPESRNLIANIKKEGPIKIFVNKNKSLKQFKAYWDVNERSIFVNYPKKSSKGQIISSILFELHNALVSSKFEYYDQLVYQGKIRKKNYIRAIEYLEYQNSLDAAKLVKKGIQLGIYPSSAYLPTYRTFDEYYRVQQMAGHSAWIAHTYDQIVPFAKTARSS